MSDENFNPDTDWYYESNGEQHGPVNHATVIQLIEHRIITPQTQVWTTGLEGWLVASQSDLASLLKPVAQHSSTPPPLITDTVTQPKSKQTIKKLNNLFFYIAYGFAALELQALRAEFTDVAETRDEIYVVSAFIALFALTPLFCVFLYRIWSLIHPKHTDITPGTAIGFLFIPFYQFYWGVVFCLHLEKGLNAQLKSCNSPLRISRPLWIASLIATAIACVAVLAMPKGSFVFEVPSTVLTIMVAYQWKEAGIRILRG